LQTLARLISLSLRASDQAFRYGGEEFVVLLPEIGLDVAVLLAERLRLSIASRNEPGDQAMCTVSIGAAEYRAGEGENALINRADEACYMAKAQGRNRVVLAT